MSWKRIKERDDKAGTMNDLTSKATPIDNKSRQLFSSRHQPVSFATTR